MGKFFLIVLLLAIFTIALVIGLDNLDKRLKAECFAWSLPDNCFLIIANPTLYTNTMCYYVQDVQRCTNRGVIFHGCLVDINNPDGYKKGSISKMALPIDWIASNKTKITCIEYSALSEYLKKQKNNG